MISDSLCVCVGGGGGGGDRGVPRHLLMFTTYNVLVSSFLQSLSAFISADDGKST